MKNMKRFAILLVVLMIFVSMCAACTKEAVEPEKTEAKATNATTESKETEKEAEEIAATEESTPYDDAIIIGVFPNGGAPDETFDAAWANCGGLWRRIFFDRLILCDENLIPKYPALATKWTISEDELTYTFTIRDDAKWHDGEPITAEDVAWSIKMATQSGSIKSNFANSFKKIEGVTEYVEGTATEISGVSVDGNVLTVKLASKDAYFLLTMAQWPPYPKHLLEGEDPATLHLASFWQNPVGSGPYKITEIEFGNYVVFEPFEDYYGGVAKVPKFMMVTSSDEIILNVESGKLDYWVTDVVDEAQAIGEIEGMRVTPLIINYSRYLMANLNDGSDAIKDVKVRQALLYAIDRQSIVDEMFEGAGEVLDSKVPSGFWKNDDLNKYEFDPELAKTMLKEAGWDENEVITLAYYYKDQTSKDVMAAIQYYWSQVGVKCETKLLEGNLLELIYETRDFDFLYAAVGALNLFEMYGIYATDYNYNRFNYGGPEIDSLLKKVSETSDIEEQKRLWFEMQEYENENLEFMPLLAPYNFICERVDKFTRPEVFGNEYFSYDQKFLEWTIN